MDKFLNEKSEEDMGNGDLVHESLKMLYPHFRKQSQVETKIIGLEEESIFMSPFIN